jgi:prophage regulatory protein
MSTNSERSRRSLKAVKETAPTTTAPGRAWAPPPLEEPTSAPVRLLDKRHVVDRVGVSFPTIWKWMRAGKFPRARQIGDLKSVWIESEVEAWITALPLRRLKDDEPHNACAAGASDFQRKT